MGYRTLLNRLKNAPQVIALMSVAMVASGDEPDRSVSPMASLLSDWIITTRDAVLSSGTESIPVEVREALEGYIPGEILDKVRWQSVSDEALTLKTIFYFGHTPAITLDYVVVFDSESGSVDDPKLWAHELSHVMQFDRWGVSGFARRYVEDYASVEEEAAEFRWNWMQQTGRVPPPG